MNYLIKTWFGYFIINESLEIKEKNFYPKEIDKLIEKNQNSRKLQEIEKEQGIDLDFPPKSLEKQFKEKKWNKLSKDYSDLRKNFFIKLTEQKIKKGFKKKGESIIRAVNLLSDLDKSISLIREGTNDFFEVFNEKNNLEEIKQELAEIEDPSQEEKTIEEVTKANVALDKSRNQLKLFIEEEMKNFAPNLSEIAGEILGAKLISLAGGLKKLATNPSGTIQVLGAEKALFRHLRDGSAPPKHGIIFEHPYVRNTHWENRGKIARALASKIAIAARIDYFSKKDKSKELKEELNQRLEEVRKNS